jgi:transcription initiation factor TFIIH subunit 1
VSVLGELSPGGILMQSCTSQQLDREFEFSLSIKIMSIILPELVPKDLQLELRRLYCALCELLRHFWACFPTTSKSLEEKVAIHFLFLHEMLSYSRMLA